MGKIEAGAARAQMPQRFFVRCLKSLGRCDEDAVPFMYFGIEPWGSSFAILPTPKGLRAFYVEPFLANAAPEIQDAPVSPAALVRLHDVMHEIDFADWDDLYRGFACDGWRWDLECMGCASVGRNAWPEKLDVVVSWIEREFGFRYVGLR